jgi:hypothetical protein
MAKKSGNSVGGRGRTVRYTSLRCKRILPSGHAQGGKVKSSGMGEVIRGPWALGLTEPALDTTTPQRPLVVTGWRLEFVGLLGMYDREQIDVEEFMNALEGALMRFPPASLVRAVEARSTRSRLPETVSLREARPS